MKTTILYLNYLLLTLVWALPVAAQDSNLSADQKAIKDCFGYYKAALMTDDGDQAVATASERTLKYYDNLLNIIKTGDSLLIEEQPLLDKLTILMTRMSVPQETLLKLNEGKSLLKLLIDKGLNNKNTINSYVLGNPYIEKNVGKAPLLKENKESGIYLYFYKQNEEWKIDITSMNKPVNESFKKMLSEQNISESTFLKVSLEAQTGKKLFADIWKPLIK